MTNSNLSQPKNTLHVLNIQFIHITQNSNNKPGNKSCDRNTESYCGNKENLYIMQKEIKTVSTPFLTPIISGPKTIKGQSCGHKVYVRTSARKCSLYAGNKPGP